MIEGPVVLRARSIPYWAIPSSDGERLVGFVILGSVSWRWTGAEALPPKMGHFREGPIRAAGVWSSCRLNYLGQGALVLITRQTDQPFSTWLPHLAYWRCCSWPPPRRHAKPAVIRGFSIPASGAAGPAAAHRHQEHFRDQVARSFFHDGRKRMRSWAWSCAGSFQNSPAWPSAKARRERHHVHQAPWAWVGPATLALGPPARRRLLVPIALVTRSYVVNLLKLAMAPGAADVRGRPGDRSWDLVRGVRILTEQNRGESLSIIGVCEFLSRRPAVPHERTAIFLTANTDLAPVELSKTSSTTRCCRAQRMTAIGRPRRRDQGRGPRAIEPINADFKRVI